MIYLLIVLVFAFVPLGIILFFIGCYKFCMWYEQFQRLDERSEMDAPMGSSRLSGSVPVITIDACSDPGGDVAQADTIEIVEHSEVNNSDTNNKCNGTGETEITPQHQTGDESNNCSTTSPPSSKETEREGSSQNETIISNMNEGSEDNPQFKSNGLFYV